MDYVTQIEKRNEELTELLASTQKEFDEYKNDLEFRRKARIFMIDKNGIKSNANIIMSADIVISYEANEYVVIKNRFGKNYIKVSEDQVLAALGGDIKCLSR